MSRKSLERKIKELYGSNYDLYKGVQKYGGYGWIVVPFGLPTINLGKTLPESNEIMEDRIEYAEDQAS